MLDDEAEMVFAYLYAVGGLIEEELHDSVVCPRFFRGPGDLGVG
jgi:hypothetical protein